MNIETSYKNFNETQIYVKIIKKKKIKTNICIYIYSNIYVVTQIFPCPFCLIVNVPRGPDKNYTLLENGKRRKEYEEKIKITKRGSFFFKTKRKKNIYIYKCID